MKRLPIKKIFAAIALSALLQSCANRLPELTTDPVPLPLELSKKPTSSDALATAPLTNVEDNQALEFVAQDLVAALSFISGVSPTEISIRTPPANTKFNRLVQDAMLKNGYSFDQRFGQSKSMELVTSYRQKEMPSGYFELTAVMSINSILVRRSYIIQGEDIVPGSSYYIRGVDPQLVQVTALVNVL